MRFPIAKTFLALGTDLIAVMYKGRIVETGDREQIFDHPEDRYTQALLSALPISDPSPRGTRRRIVMDEG